MAPLPALCFEYRGNRVQLASGRDAHQFIRDFESVVSTAEEKLEVPAGTYDFYDQYGKIFDSEDLLRALKTTTSNECTIEIREHSQFTRLRELQEQDDVLAAGISRLGSSLEESEARSAQKTEDAEERVRELIDKINKRIKTEVQAVLESLSRDRTDLKKRVGTLEDKISTLGIQDMREMVEKAGLITKELKQTRQRMDDMDAAFARDKALLYEDSRGNKQEMKELQRYMQGKIDVCIDADADMRREQQLCNERLGLVADDLSILSDGHVRLTRQCTGALEESEELRIVMGQVREDNEHFRAEIGSLRTQMRCLGDPGSRATSPFGRLTGVTSPSGTRKAPAEETLAEGLGSEVLYFRQWHKVAKGNDVQLSNASTVATGRGFLAATGVVIGCDEGLVVADGPCRRFGTPGFFSSYYELEIEEISSAPSGAGGLYVGMTVQSGDEIAGHPRHEFDGWLIGGESKALVCRAGPAGPGESLSKTRTGAATKQATSSGKGGTAALESAAESMALLRTALPTRLKGGTRECESMWSSRVLQVGDRIGVLFRCNRAGGARLRVAVNSELVATHEFMDAPSAEAVEYLTPVVRLAGTGKSARLLPGLQPPVRLLAD